MKENTNQLRKELRQVGASAAEVNELLPIVSRLNRLSQHPAAVKNNSPKRLARVFKPMPFVASSLALGTFLVIVSQTASPTSFLYPVQKFSDSVAIGVQPQYRATVMMKRAQQVKLLVFEHASSQQVLATLADYMMEARAYQSTPQTNYAAFEFCKTNLQQAAASASPTVKQAITSSLQSLETT